MLVRLGNVLGWVGNILGILLVGGGVCLLVYLLLWGDRTMIEKSLFASMLLIVPGVLAFLLGRAFRYILCGPSAG